MVDAVQFKTDRAFVGLPARIALDVDRQGHELILALRTCIAGLLLEWQCRTCNSLFECGETVGDALERGDRLDMVQLRGCALGDRWEPVTELTLRPLRQAVRAA